MAARTTRGRAPDHAWTVLPLDRSHDRTSFNCGVPALNDYLARRAGQDQDRKVATCHVAASLSAPARVLGYYTLSSYSVRVGELPPSTVRRLPRYPMVPAALIGRLAVERAVQGQGRGEFLLMDAVRRLLGLAREMAIFAVLVDAKDDNAAAFYSRYDFQPFPSEPLRLFLPLATAAAAFGEPLRDEH